MNYKTLLLSILISPYTIFANNSLQKLKQLQSEKLLEVHNVSREIIEICRYIQDTYELYRMSLSYQINERIEEMDNAVSKDEMRSIILDENKAIYRHIYNALAGEDELDESIINNAFLDGSPDSFCLDKFLETSDYIEYLRIKNAVEKYKQALRELITLNNEIRNFFEGSDS